MIPMIPPTMGTAATIQPPTDFGLKDFSRSTIEHANPGFQSFILPS
jgi:hypothetical protein